MRKIHIYLLVMCLFFVMTGCVKTDNDKEEKTSDSQQVVEEKNEDSNIVKENDVIKNELSDSVKEENNMSANQQGMKKEDNISESEKKFIDNDITIEEEEDIPFPNPYFYNQNQTVLEAEYYEHWGNLSNETVDMQISFVKSYEQGNVYKFTIDLLPDLFPSYFRGENMNIYLYVTEDKIYRLRPYVQPQPNGETYYFYDDDELLIQMLDTDEKVMNNGEIVCQEEETDEEYSSIKVNGNQITYSRHETKPNGENGYKEIFVWEKGKGLIEYKVGFGLQPYAVYLGEISEVELPQDYSDILEYKNLNPQLMASDLITMSDGSIQELDLFWHYKEDDPRSIILLRTLNRKKWKSAMK